MKRILLGVDGSPESGAAATFTADLAEQTGSSIILVYVIAPPVTPPPAMALLEDPVKMDEDYGRGVLREMAERCRRPGVAVETLMPVGPPAEVLADTARTREADLVVVGHRGRGAVKRLLLGSVVARLLRLSPRPVLVVR